MLNKFSKHIVFCLQILNVVNWNHRQAVQRLVAYGCIHSTLRQRPTEPQPTEGITINKYKNKQTKLNLSPWEHERDALKHTHVPPSGIDERSDQFQQPTHQKQYLLWTRLDLVLVHQVYSLSIQ